MSEELTIGDKLNCLYTDFCMLEDGSWDGDPGSCGDSITILERVVKDLKEEGILPAAFELEDTRGEADEDE